MQIHVASDTTENAKSAVTIFVQVKKLQFLLFILYKKLIMLIHT